MYTYTHAPTSYIQLNIHGHVDLSNEPQLLWLQTAMRLDIKIESHSVRMVHFCQYQASSAIHITGIHLSEV